MKIALITGAFGQDGYFLTKHLLETGDYYIICTANAIGEKLNPVYINKNITLEKLDIGDKNDINHCIKKYKPDELYHLAAFAAPILSWQDPENVISINGLSAAVFLEAIHLFSLKTKVFFPSSGKIFGQPIITPQNENTPVNPLDPYSLGKYLAHQIVKIYRKKYNIFACNGILYNHESHLKGTNFVTSKICYNSVLLKQKKITSFSLLNFDSEIDLGDPRDYVDAMHLILQQPNPDDYIIAMNKSVSIKEICLLVGEILEINDILSFIKVEKKNINLSKNKFRGDNTKLKSIGWSPKYTLKDTLKMILCGDSNF